MELFLLFIEAIMFKDVGCLPIIIITFVLCLMSAALKGCDDRPYAEIQAERAWKLHADKYNDHD